VSRAGRAAVVVRRATLAEIIALRHAELRPGLPRETAHFDGDDDPGTRHFAAFPSADPDPVGCASLMAQPWQDEPAFQLRGMATRAALVRRGIGAAVLGGVESDVRADTDVRVLWCHARLAAVPFYRRLGWAVVSDVYDIPSVGPHHTMVRRLA
jgi:GNAT superfamily N-acetyltransferase